MPRDQDGHPSCWWTHPGWINSASFEPLEDRRCGPGRISEVQKMVWGGPDKQLSAVRKGTWLGNTATGLPALSESLL